MLGETLGGRYTILRLIGEGGMGSVYEARHLGTNRRVAVKVITGDLIKHASVVARFELEAKAAGAIESQHIAQVLDVGRDEERGLPFMVMEYLEGEDLHALQARLRHVPPGLAIRIGVQACIGLSRAHGSNIIHRDVKPANIFLARRDDEIVVKLLDFGIAKVLLDESQKAGSALTRTGNLIGTPLYMSPEQASGDRPLDARSDVWSLGVVLYQALCGKTPHHQIEAMGKLIISICSEPAPPIQRLAPWVPGELAAIIEQSLALEPEDRFQSADEMMRALKTLVPHTQIDRSMLVPLTEEERAVVGIPATRRSRISDVRDLAPPASRGARGSYPALVITPPQAVFTPATGTLNSPGAVNVVGSTMQIGPPTTGISASQVIPSTEPAPGTRKPSRLPIILGGLALAAGAAAVVVRLAWPAPPRLASPGPSVTAAPEVPAAPSAASPPKVSPEPSTGPAEAESAPTESAEPSATPSAEVKSAPAKAAPGKAGPRKKGRDPLKEM